MLDLAVPHGSRRSHPRRHAARRAHAAPEEPAAWRGLGLVATRLGDYKEARAAFERYLTLAPNAGDAAAIRAREQALPQRPAGARHGNAD